MHEEPVAGRWATVVPWDRQGHLNLTNTNYLLAFCRRYRLERPRRLRGRDGVCACGHRSGGMRADFDGDHDECDCPKRQWAKSLVHHTIVDALCRFLKDCGFDNVDKEVKFWDPCREGTDKSRRVPDVVCTHPHSGKQYVVDARIFWNSLSSSSAGYVAYADTGWGAESGERQKRASWDKAVRRKRDVSACDVDFVPFSLEAGGVWGPAATKFFRECMAVAGGDRDIDLYHWSTPRFSSVWQDTLSVLVARGRARVSVSASAADWPKRIRDMQYVDHDDFAVAH